MWEDDECCGQDPCAAIPKGTLLAILTTTVSYIIFALLAGAECLRDVTGPVMDVNATGSFFDANATDAIVQNWEFANNCSQYAYTPGCNWGMHNSFQVRVYSFTRHKKINLDDEYTKTDHEILLCADYGTYEYIWTNYLCW